jgi:Isochorismatase family
MHSRKLRAGIEDETDLDSWIGCRVLILPLTLSILPIGARRPAPDGIQTEMINPWKVERAHEQTCNPRRWSPERLFPVWQTTARRYRSRSWQGRSRDRGRPRECDEVIHIRHEFTRPDAPFFAPGSQGAAIHPSVRPIENESIIVKNHANSFRETELKRLLDAKGIEDVLVIGAMSHMCIDGTTRAAADFGYKATVLHDACATRNLEFGGRVVPAAEVQAAFMAALASSYASVVTTSVYLSR